jgi:hypothetical protein
VTACLRRRKRRLASSSRDVGWSTSQTVGEAAILTGNDRCPSLLIVAMSGSRKFVSLGMFIIDEFAFADAAGKPTGCSLSPQERVLFFTPVHTRAPSGLFVHFSTSDWWGRHLCRHWRTRVVRGFSRSSLPSSSPVG